MTSARASENSGETLVGQVCLVLLPHAVGISSSGSTLASLLGCWSVLFTQTLAMSRAEWRERVRNTSRIPCSGCHKMPSGKPEIRKCVEIAVDPDQNPLEQFSSEKLTPCMSHPFCHHPVNRLIPMPPYNLVENNQQLNSKKPTP